MHEDTFKSFNNEYRGITSTDRFSGQRIAGEDSRDTGPVCFPNRCTSCLVSTGLLFLSVSYIERYSSTANFVKDVFLCVFVCFCRVEIQYYKFKFKKKNA